MNGIVPPSPMYIAGWPKNSRLASSMAWVSQGDMAGAFDLYTAGVRETVYSRSTALATRDLTFVPSTHADSTGMVGCAAVVINHLLSPERLDAHLDAVAR